MNSETIITIDNLKYKYRNTEKNALDGISLKINKGEFIGIIGPSLAGKSTFCLTLNGLIPQTVRGKMSGTVKVFDNDTADVAANALFKDVAMVFQDFEVQLFSTNAALDVAFGPENLALSTEEIHKRVDECLEMVDLKGFGTREPATLSGGEKQRLAIASALALHSPILALDEPTTDLDPLGKERIMKIADRLRRSENFTILCVEHEIEELIYANRIIMIVKGKVVLDGDPRDVFDKVDFIRENGVMPLGSCNLMHALHLKEPVLSIDEAVTNIKGHGLKPSQEVFQDLIEADNKREKSYGNVIIKAENVSYSYDNKTFALNNVNLNVREREFLAIIGQNGSGKTTLAKQFNGLLKNTHGKVEVYGQDAKNTSILTLSKYVGYVFQNPDHQIFADTVFDEVAFGPRNFGLDDKAVKQAVTDALKAVNLVGQEEEDPFFLTKGGRQRVAVASVLAVKPKVIILDEPTTGLDYKEQIGMMDLLKKLNEQGRTIIIVTHTMWVVSHYAHRAVVMNNGEIVLNDTVRNVFKNENKLINMHLKPPQITQIGNRWGYPFLTIDEARKCFLNNKKVK